MLKYIIHTRWKQVQSTSFVKVIAVFKKFCNKTLNAKAISFRKYKTGTSMYFKKCLQWKCFWKVEPGPLIWSMLGVYLLHWIKQLKGSHWQICWRINWRCEFTLKNQFSNTYTSIYTICSVHINTLHSTSSTHARARHVHKTIDLLSRCGSFCCSKSSNMEVY